MSTSDALSVALATPDGLAQPAGASGQGDMASVLEALRPLRRRHQGTYESKPFDFYPIEAVEDAIRCLTPPAPNHIGAVERMREACAEALDCLADQADAEAFGSSDEKWVIGCRERELGFKHAAATIRALPLPEVPPQPVQAAPRVGLGDGEVGWLPIESAPKDGTPIIGAFWDIRRADSHRKGDIVRCWWQPEFDAFISSCREMSLAAGLTFADGSSRQLHHPVIEPVTHWRPLLPPPGPAQAEPSAEIANDGMWAATERARVAEERAAKLSSGCPFDGPANQQPEPHVPCPVCGDLGTFDTAVEPSKCVSNPTSRKRLAEAEIERLRSPDADPARPAQDGLVAALEELRPVFDACPAVHFALGAHPIDQEIRATVEDNRLTIGKMSTREIGLTVCVAVNFVRAALSRSRTEAPQADRAAALETQAVRDVLAERRRQVEAEGWTPEHDDTHAKSELAAAAACYALGLASVVGSCEAGHAGLVRIWPWARSWWKPTCRRRDLVKAGALILAEIERLDRALASKAGGEVRS